MPSKNLPVASGKLLPMHRDNKSNLYIICTKRHRTKIFIDASDISSNNLGIFVIQIKTAKINTICVI